MNKVKIFIKENNALVASLILLLILLICIFSLNNNETKGNEALYEINSELNPNIDLDENGNYAKYYKEKDFICSSLNEKIYLADSKSFISYDGSKYSYYLYNISKKYENEQNCLLIFQTDKKIIGYNHYVENGYLRKNGIVYSDLTYDKVENRQLVTIGKYIRHIERTEILKSNYDYIYFYQLTDLIGGSLSSSLFVCKQAIYENIEHEPKQALEVFEGHNIQKVFPHNVISETDVFTYGVKDKSCYDYVDRKCEYGFTINNDLKKYIDYIAFMNEHYIVFKDGSSYYYDLYSEMVN